VLTKLLKVAKYYVRSRKRTASIPEITDMPLLRRLKLSINEAIKIARDKFGVLLRVC